MTESCQQYDALIARAAQLTAEESARLEAHLAGCDACRELARAVKPVDGNAAFVATGIADTMTTLTGPSVGPPRESSELGTERYRITGEVGRGGIGRVLRALDQVLDRPVALKELFSASEAMRSRFIREALITARLQHPSIVPVYDAGHLGDRSPFYAMKLVAGRPLDKSIAEAATLAQRLALLPTVLAVADAIAYAHNERIIHRDLKPTNILVGKYGETIVIDWGLAKDLATDDREALEAGPYRGADQTIVGSVLGTPAYMAPEQAAGAAVDERADVYALGAILYHVISGAIPHEGDTLEAMVGHVIAGEVRPLTERVPEVPRDLAAIVAKAMALAPEQRYPNAQGFADDLRRFSTGQLVASHTYGARELLRRWIRQHRGAVSVGLAALLVLGVVGTLSIRNIVIARGEATASREDARGRLAASYVDRAGNELVHQQPARSLAYTIASAQVTGLAPQTRLMAAHALDQLPPLRWWLAPKGGVTMFAPGSHDLVFGTNEIVRWNTDTNRVVWRVPENHPGNLVLVARDTLAFARDKSIALISIATGAQIGELAGSPGAHYSGLLAMDASGRWMAAPGSERIDLFDTTTRALVASIPFANPWRSPQVAADGEHVVTGEESDVMSVLDRSGRVLATFKAQLGTVLIAGDELVYATPVGANGLARLEVASWTGTARLDLPVGVSPINALAVDVAAKRIALGCEDGTVQVRSLVSGELLWQAALGDRAGAVLFDGNVLRVAGSSTVAGFDVASGLEVEHASIPGAAFLVASDDHARAAAIVFGTGLAVWASARGELAPIAPTSAMLGDVALAPNGVVIAAGSDGEINEVRDGQTLRHLASGSPINTLSRLDDGTLIAATSDGATVVRDRDGRELRRFAGGVSARPSPDGHLVATATADGTVALVDPRTGETLRTLGKFGTVRTLRWSLDGRRVAVLTMQGNVSVWDASGTLVRSIPTGNFAGSTIALSNDGKWLARTGEPANTLFALDGGSDRKLLESDRQGGALVVAFSPDNTTVLVAGLGFLSTWNVATAAPRLRIATNGFVTAAAFFENGAFILAGGMDRQMHVWNADTGAEVLAFTVPGHPQKIVVDGSRIAVLAGRSSMVWTVPAYRGSLEELRERARCTLDLEVVDAHLQARSIDLTACNRTAW